MEILIIGAGGQGQVVADAVLFASEAGQDIALVGYLDDNDKLWHQEFLGAPVLGPIAKWKEVSHDAVIICIGSNAKRKDIYDKLSKQGAKFVTIKHPKALIGHDVTIGNGSYIGAYVIVAAGTKIGNNTIIHGNSVIGHHNIIGDHVHIAPGVNTAGDVEISTGVMVGISASIMPQRKIGDWVVIGSATLVNRDVPAGLTVIGVPCRELNKP
jgi:sugar O-acyltransferase (sialic acid O-acetyltransferase NeuD family)